ncbi:hypothetical protein E6C67_02030 [Azospirillum sp. TSA2s]|uniref:hypothetical protein n=1 Tax=Azospirillum sp. TSA2s TaxID=709810 RepID=UPI0010AA81CA|nr:hypothetical protein [Azospirillum sp. TSA2s]QCG92716.1 hypothetical protein E6C67_02030 [Azospirillum sp. TSA2s]
MTMGAFPEDASGRRAVAVLEQHEIENCQRKGETQVLTDLQTHVLVYPVTESNGSQALTNILDAGLNRPGTLLIQSPFDLEEYVDAAEASQQFALAKHTLFSNFCQLLGATRVSVTQMDIVTNGDISTMKADGGRLVVSGEIGMDKTATDSLCSQLSLIDEYAGGEPELDEAEKLLRSYRLAGDPNMKSLLQARKAAGNPLTKRTLTVNLSTEANKNLKVVGRLQLPVSAFGAEYQHAVKQTKEYKLTLEVLFPGT